ncbi:MAG TPA: hypothetical protein VGG46_17015, partial [Terriglobales bacterium]
GFCDEEYPAACPEPILLAPEEADADGAFGCCAELLEPPTCAQAMRENAKLPKTIPRAAIMIRENLLNGR